MSKIYKLCKLCKKDCKQDGLGEMIECVQFEAKNRSAAQKAAHIRNGAFDGFFQVRQKRAKPKNALGVHPELIPDGCTLGEIFPLVEGDSVYRKVKRSALKQFRKAYKINQETMAAALGVSVRAFRDLEGGTGPMSKQMARQVEALLAGTGANKEPSAYTSKKGTDRAEI